MQLWQSAWLYAASGTISLPSQLTWHTADMAACAPPPLACLPASLQPQEQCTSSWREEVPRQHGCCGPSAPSPPRCVMSKHVARTDCSLYHLRLLSMHARTARSTTCACLPCALSLPHTKHSPPNRCNAAPHVNTLPCTHKHTHTLPILASFPVFNIPHPFRNNPSRPAPAPGQIL